MEGAWETVHNELVWIRYGTSLFLLDRLVKSNILLLFSVSLLWLHSQLPAEDVAAVRTGRGWQAGVAVAEITPQAPIMLEGFASRREPAREKETDLFAKALALQDAHGTRLVMITMDLIGIPRPLRERVSRRIEDRYQLPPASLLMNASHTHCGPELRMTETALEELTPQRQKRTKEYCARLEDALCGLVGRALGMLRPAELRYSHARAGFAMNRRLQNSDPSGEPYLNHPNPDGLVDHSVPVLQVLWQGGKRAVLFGYACHNTTLYVNRYAGDYAGYAQQFLEEDYPGTTALFLSGCGGDQSGYPRGTVEQSRRHGRTLATAVEAAWGNRQTIIRGPLVTKWERVTIEYQTPPTRAQLAAHLAADHAESSFRDYELTRPHAKRLLRELVRHGKLRTSYDYPVQTLQLGNQLLVIALAGEVVVDYALRLKRELAGRCAVWVSGYNNDVFAYIPSRRLLLEGGYEPRRSMNYYTTTVQPGPFAHSIEDRIVEKVHELLR